jgi:hypothetical protein
MRSRAWAVMTGPISLPGLRPGPTVTSSACARRRSTSGSATSPTATTTEIAMHRCPAEP